MKFQIIMLIFLIPLVLAETTFFDNENEAFTIGTITTTTAEKNPPSKQRIHLTCPESYRLKNDRCVLLIKKNESLQNRTRITNQSQNISLPTKKDVLNKYHSEENNEFQANPNKLSNKEMPAKIDAILSQQMKIPISRAKMLSLYAAFVIIIVILTFVFLLWKKKRKLPFKSQKIN